MQITPSFVFDLERRMQIVSAAEYQRLLSNLYWRKLARELPSSGKSERLIWLLDSAKIDYVNRLGGEVEFADLVTKTTEYTNQAATGGLRLHRFQLEDLDGGGLQIANEWSRQIGAYSAYWPQKQIASLIRNGALATSLAYDSQIFFSGAHPYNPFETAFGTYTNNFTAGSGPGAVPIDTSISLDVAFANFAKAVAYIHGQIKMPNGEDPRMLRVAYVVAPPALAPRIQQITQAKFIAQAASAGGGSSDVEAVVKGWGLGEPVIAPELSSAFTNGSDTTYYLVCEELASDQMGAFLYVNREPFQVIYHSDMTDADLARMNELQWITRGRNTTGYGHPYLVFRCLAA